MSNLEVAKSNITNGKATASLVLGILSIVFLIIPLLGIILGVVGIVLGIIGLQEAKRLEQRGKKIAVSGIICSSLGILLPVFLAILAGIVFLNGEINVKWTRL